MKTWLHLNRVLGISGMNKRCHTHQQMHMWWVYMASEISVFIIIGQNCWLHLVILLMMPLLVLGLVLLRVFQPFLTWTNLLYLSPVKPHNNGTQKERSCPSHVNNDSHRSPSFLKNWLDLADHCSMTTPLAWHFHNISAHQHTPANTWATHPGPLGLTMSTLHTFTIFFQNCAL